MKAKKLGKWLLLAAGVTGMALAQAGQGTPAGQSGQSTPGTQGAQGKHGGMGQGELGQLGIGRGPTVTGLPFQATATLAVVRPGQNGAAPTTQQRTVTFARDNDGRTYLKTMTAGRNGAAPQPVIYLNDPVAKKTYVIDPVRKVATVREYSAAPTGGAVAGEAGGMRHGHGNTTLSPLEAKTIAGVQASGTKRVTSFPPRQGAAEQTPVTVTTSIWTAPDIHVVLEADSQSSRGGQMNYQVQTLQQGAPDSSLFTVPSGYTLRQHGGNGGGN